MPKTVDTVPQPPLLIKQKQTLLVIAILLVLLPISIWAVNQMTAKPPKAANLPLGSVRINPEQIVTDLGGTTIYLSALAYDTGGSPISSGISYQRGFSTTNSIGVFTPNGTTNLASFKPSQTIKGRGDIWVKAFGVNGQTATKSIPVYVGVVPEITLLDSVRINPEKIDTVRNAPSIQLSALAYKNGAPVWEGISYEWGMSTISPIGQLIRNANTKLASFEPSHSATGTGDLWVRASDEGGHSAIRSIPVTVGYPMNTPSPTLPITTSAPVPTSTPTPAGRSISITTPNGGETLIVGQQYKIKWNSNLINKVSLGYSTGPGNLNWIITNINNVGYYDWTVFKGNTTNTQFKIQIIGYQTGVGSVTDTSDNYFTILYPTPSPFPTPTLKPTATPTPTPTVCKPADINRDGKVNGNDLSILFTNILSTSPSPVRADINADGIVDITDYSILVRDYDTSTGVCQ